MSNQMMFPLSVGALDSLSSYLAAIRRMPLLSAEDEYNLACQLRDHGDRSAAERLVLSHLRFVVSVAREYRGYGLSFEDLIQEGTIGLMRAVRRFDPDKGVRLAGFAVYHIKCEIWEFVLKNWKLVKVATTKAQRKLFFKLRSYVQQLSWMDAREIEEVACDLSVSPKDIELMRRRLNSRDVTYYDDPTDAYEDNPESPCRYYCHGDDRLIPELLVEEDEYKNRMLTELTASLSILDERSSDIVKRRWLSERKETLEALGEKYGVTKERIRQIETRALAQLRSHIELSFENLLVN